MIASTLLLKQEILVKYILIVPFVNIAKLRADSKKRQASFLWLARHFSSYSVVQEFSSILKAK